MRHQNWHPEWGFLAPAPSFIRAVRIVLVATAVGATIGASVVLSLVDSSANQPTVAERTLVRPLQAPLTPINAQVNPRTTTTSDAPGKVAAALSPAAGTGPADLAPVQKKATKKHRVEPRYESRGGLFGLLLGERHHTWGFSGG